MDINKFLAIVSFASPLLHQMHDNTLQIPRNKYANKCLIFCFIK